MIAQKQIDRLHRVGMIETLSFQLPFCSLSAKQKTERKIEQKIRQNYRYFKDGKLWYNYYIHL